MGLYQMAISMENHLIHYWFLLLELKWYHKHPCRIYYTTVN
jgi:hypothetical protein